MSRFGLTMRAAALAVGFGCIGVSASASILTYDFSGTFTFSDDPSVPLGTPFTGSFSYDAAAPPDAVATNATFYDTTGDVASLQHGNCAGAVAAGANRRHARDPCGAEG